MRAQAPTTQARAPESIAVEASGPTGLPVERRLLPALIPALVSAISAYVVLAALGRRLPGEFGSAAALVACAVILSVPGSILQVARSPMTKRAPRASNGAGVSTPLSRTLGALVAGSFLILGLTRALEGFLGLERGTSGLLGPYAFLSAVAGLVISASRSHIDARRFSAIAAVRLGVSVVLGFLFLHYGLGLAGLLLALVAGEAAVVALVAAWRLIGVVFHSRPDDMQPPFLPEMSAPQAWLAAALIGSLWLVSHFDVVLARHYLLPHRDDYYAAAWTLVHVLLGPIVLAGVYTFRVSRRWTLAASDWLRKLLGGTWAFALVSVGLLLAFRHQALSLIFGPRLVPANSLVPALAVSMGLFTAGAVMAQFHVFARSRAYLLVLAAFMLEVVLVSLFHSNDAFLYVSLGAVGLSAGGLYHAAMAISRWPQPLGGLSPHEELIPTAETRKRQRRVELSIVLPCHNAGSQLREFLVSVQGHLDARVPTEIIVVSDGSTDDTVRIAGDFASSGVRVFHYPEQLGKGHALRVGLHQARGDYVAFIDSDGDIDPEAIVPVFSLMQLYQPDIVVASKRHPLSQVEYPPLRRVLSWVYHVIGRVLFRINVRDTQTGLKLIRRDVLAAVLPKMLEKRYAFDLELLVVARRLGYTRIFEAPVKIHYRFSSNVNPKAAFRILLDTGGIFYRRYVLNTYAPLAPVIEPPPSAQDVPEAVPEAPGSGT